MFILLSVIILEKFYFRNLNDFVKCGPKNGQTVPHLDGHQYAVSITRNHNMISDISML